MRAAGASQDDIQLKIADFGLAADLAGVEDGKMHESYGSPEYAAPEILKDGPGYGIEVDLWSLGVIVFMMLSGVLPFSADDLGTMRRKVQNQSVDICFRQTAEQWAQVSAEGQAFVRSLLVKEPQSRTPCAKLLTSEWIDPEAFRVAKEEAEAAAAKAAEEAAMIAAAEADFEEGVRRTSLHSIRSIRGLTSHVRRIHRRAPRRVLQIAHRLGQAIRAEARMG